MGTVDRECSAARPCGGTLPARGARPWQALTASLSVVVCCLVWLCIRQCHALIFKTRAEQSENERARVVAKIAAAQAQIAEAAVEARYAFLAPLDPLLGLATVLLVIRLDAQPRMPIAALAESGDNLPFLFNDALDFSGLESGRVATQQSAFFPDGPVDQTVSLTSVWSDEATVGWWMGDFAAGKADFLWQDNIGDTTVIDFRSDDRADILWQEAGNVLAIRLLDGSNVQSGDNVGFDPGPAWEAHGAGVFNSDLLTGIEWQDSGAAHAAWLGFDLVADTAIAHIPSTDWQAIP